ncbi:hypothetical protein, partial [Zhouia amylolytica]|uniref:hypothetical protein n=1 Tax=Zhouia amylolytica TaxID=376730 RepID=UPI0020CE0156
MEYYLFGIIVLISCLFLYKRKSLLSLFVIVFTVFLVLNAWVYNLSVEQGKQGYSIFTKDILDDEIIYYEAGLNKYLTYKNHSNDIFASLDNINEIFFNHFYGNIIAVVFLLFNTDSILMARALTALFFALFMVECLRFVQILVGKNKLFLSIFLLFLYPTLIIRGLQIEQEMLINFVLIKFFNILIQPNHKKKGKSYIVILFFFKVIAFISLIFAGINKKLKFSLWLQLILLPVISVLILKFFIPDLYNYIVSVKSYVVMDGNTDVFKV